MKYLIIFAIIVMALLGIMIGIFVFINWKRLFRDGPDEQYDNK